MSELSHEFVQRLVSGGENRSGISADHGAGEKSAAGQLQAGNGPNQKDILLHRDGDNIGRAMTKLCRDVTRVMKRANDPSISCEEYMRYVAVLHFRFTSIHPFPDGNRQNWKKYYKSDAKSNTFLRENR